MTMPTEDLMQNSLVKEWRDSKSESLFYIDVCDLIESGGEPYSILISRVMGLKVSETLIIYAPFEPNPLIRQINKMGFKTEVEHIDTDRYGLRVTKTDPE